MAWTDPRDWVAGEVVTSSQMNTHVRDNTSFLFDHMEHSRQSDLSDIAYHTEGSNAESETKTVFDLSGEGLVLVGQVMGNYLIDATLTIDGTDNDLSLENSRDTNGDETLYAIVPPVKFGSSAKLTFSTGTSGGQTVRVRGSAWTKSI